VWLVQRRVVLHGTIGLYAFLFRYHA
jgi:hypothetical protein